MSTVIQTLEYEAAHFNGASSGLLYCGACSRFVGEKETRRFNEDIELHSCGNRAQAIETKFAGTGIKYEEDSCDSDRERPMISFRGHFFERHENKIRFLAIVIFNVLVLMIAALILE